MISTSKDVIPITWTHVSRNLIQKRGPEPAVQLISTAVEVSSTEFAG